MREALLIGFAVFIGVAGAVISALPAIVWFRRRKAAAALYDEFMDASAAILAFRYLRTKKPFGEGFLDSYVGEVGNLSFRLEVEIVPFRKLNVYRLRLEKRLDGEPLVHQVSSQAEPTGADPLAILAKTFRRIHAKREKYAIITEAN